MIINHNYESGCVYFLSIPFYALLNGDFYVNGRLHPNVILHLTVFLLCITLPKPTGTVAPAVFLPFVFP